MFQTLQMSTLHESLAHLSSNRIPYFSINSQSAHRLNILQSWLQIAHENSNDIESDIIGKQTLDVGCGQGDMIALFAAALKTQGDEDSKVVGVDPARLDYGAPITLGDAQASLAAGPLGSYLSFTQSTADALVASQPTGTYKAAYFAHSLYYFPSSSVLIQNLRSLLEAGVSTLLLAEWALKISRPVALPHLLAVLLQSMDPLPDGNVRTVLSPAAYIDAAKQAGWELVGSRTLMPAGSLEDGMWEVNFARDVVEKRETGKKVTQIKSERGAGSVRLESIRAHAHALEGAISSTSGIDKVECMDVWTAVFRSPQVKIGSDRA